MNDTAANLPPVPVGEQRLDPRAIAFQKMGAAIFAFVVALGSGVLGIVALADDGPSILSVAVTGALWLVGNGLFTWHGQRWQEIDYRHTSYRVDDRGLEIRRGVFWREVVTVPRSRVQHTDVSQGPLERKYGLGTLVVYTAGTDHAKVSLPGLAHEVAMAIREQLMPERGTNAV
jgi:membrane protein YdbS with pleckstrin-like domain